MRLALFGGLAFLCFAVASNAAPALTVDDDTAISAVKRTISNYVRPSTQRFADAAAKTESSIAGLCEKPDGEGLASARSAFAASLAAYAHVGILRSGPLMADNRSDRLLFWPDRRGIALRQVQSAIIENDPSVTDAAALPGKSVALQGYLALEYLLYGTGAGDLTTRGAGHRCLFAQAVAGNIRTIAEEIETEWADPAGYAGLWSTPSADNPIFRNAEEILSELISLPAEALEIIEDQQLKPITPAEEGDSVNPKLGIFWRSGLTFAFVGAEFDGLRGYFEASGLEPALPEGERWLADSVRFEFSNAGNVLQRLDGPVADIVTDEETRSALTYLNILANSLRRLFGEQIASALGLSVGFSSLDGD